MTDAVERVRWGVLGRAAIAVHKVIPAMQRSQRCEVVAIALARRRPGRRRRPSSWASPATTVRTTTLLADPDVEAVYIPLPNHLHAEWTLRAAAAGKHVLCEKPLALRAAEAAEMVEGCRAAGVLLMEAFMYRLHPLWLRVRRARRRRAPSASSRRSRSFFAYHNVDPANIRNIAEYGGGAVMDIGCYPINVARWMFDGEPTTSSAAVRLDPRFGTDAVTSAVLDFGGRHATFTCSTQIEPDQRVHLIGTTGRLLVEIPFNIPPDRPTRIVHAAGGDPPVAPGIDGVRDTGRPIPTAPSATPSPPPSATVPTCPSRRGRGRQHGRHRPHPRRARRGCGLTTCRLFDLSTCR